MNKIYKILSVTRDEENSRIDRAIKKLHPYLNQARIEKSLRNKLILVNNKKVAANYRIKIEDHIQIDMSLMQEVHYIPQKRISEDYINLIANNVIYRDGDLIAINKPAGIAVQGGSKIKISIDDIIPKMLEKIGTWHENKISHKLVHRLDKETSGILLIALNNYTAQDLALAFKEKQISKKYLAILKGRVKNNNGQISTIIDKENKQIKEINAISNYKVLSKNSNASLVEFTPITGKNHQLRLHALELGFPILGDIKYDEFYTETKENNLHLHASEIEVPYQNNILKLKAELPEYFLSSLVKLKLKL
jgi:23S rRNA pseudouridine955/2504/2580 synthase